MSKKADESTKEKGPFIIAIDGLSAAGKGTLAKFITEKLSFLHFSTGLLYRLTSYIVQQKDISLQDYEKLSNIAKNLTVQDLKDSLEKECVLQKSSIGELASKVAVIPEVRKALIKLQKDLVKLDCKGLVVDGRDIGTVIFPDADCKFFIIAPDKVRADRRFKQLQNYSKGIIYTQVLQDLKQRDERDRLRDVAPSVAAEDAIVVDTGGLTIDEAVDTMLKVVNSRFEQ